MNNLVIMQDMSLNYVARACGGRLLQGSGDALFLRVTNDSRAIQSGDLFFAIEGENFDGHDFLGQVDARGAVAVVVDARKTGKYAGLRCAVIEVENPRRALGMLAARYRTEFEIPVIAVGGSNGKTSTKELVGAVLSQKYNTVKSEASFNNDIGVPVTLLNITKETDAAVVEVGTNHPGEMKALLQIIRPDMGIITSMGREHLEFFKDLGGVEMEEGTLAEVLPADGKLFVCGDEPWSGRMAARSRAGLVYCGFKENNDWQARDIRLNGEGYDFEVVTERPEYSGQYRLNLLGRHQVINALYALAVGAELGLSREEMASGLAACKPAKMRMQMWLWNGVVILDDAYNANADSMKAALETLREMPCTGRKVAVLGDMAELGDQSLNAHQEVGRMTAECGVDYLFAIGTMADCVVEASRSGGLKNAFSHSDQASVSRALKEFLKPGDMLLLKASRSARLERLVALLKSDTKELRE